MIWIRFITEQGTLEEERVDKKRWSIVPRVGDQVYLNSQRQPWTVGKVSWFVGKSGKHPDVEVQLE